MFDAHVKHTTPTSCFFGDLHSQCAMQEPCWHLRCPECEAASGEDPGEIMSMVISGT